MSNELEYPTHAAQYLPKAPLPPNGQHRKGNDSVTSLSPAMEGSGTKNSAIGNLNSLTSSGVGKVTHRPIEDLSVIHIGNIAGISTILSRTQREIGVKSDVLEFDVSPFKYSSDYTLASRFRFPLNSIDRTVRLLDYVRRYDVLHFHFSTMLPRGIDCALWKGLSKKIVVHYHGSDVRGRGAKLVCRSMIDGIVVSTPDLLEWVDDAVWIANPIILDDFSVEPAVDKAPADAIRIAHAPSNRAKKGTKYVIEACKELQREGYKIALDIVEGVPHEQAILRYRKADIVVDQLLVGWYGMFAIESMALGKPVCVNIRHDLLNRLPFIPFALSDVDTLKTQIKELVEDADLRARYGSLGRKFVTEIHDAGKVAGKLVDIYLDSF